jgi:penicillin-binding protein 2
VSTAQQNRPIYIRVFFILLTGMLVFKALQLQLLDDTYARRAEATAIDKFTLYPSRGLIYDRNGKLLINNNPVFDLLATYNQVSPEMDTTKFCDLLGITPTDYKDWLNKDWNSPRYSKRQPFVFMSTIPSATFTRFYESLYQFPGFYMQSRSVRGYPQPHAAHVLGFIREVDQYEIEQSGGKYRLGDYIGGSGLEKTYEKELRGQKGARYVLKDNLGREVGSYKDGDLDTTAISGKNLITSLDIDLQAYAEELMNNKIGGIVAIEPKTGEVLVFASSPSYDPNLLTINRTRGAAVAQLSRDTLKPFFNRAVMAKYPPGSIFKPLMALIALQEGVIEPQTYIPCPGYYAYNNYTWGCRAHPAPTDVGKAIQHSCNTYFFNSFRRVVDIEGFYEPEKGLDRLVNHLYDFGLGSPMGIDFPGETGGNIPTVAYYDKKYPKEKGSWKSPTIISLGIGQGELQLTTLQMANMTAAIANRGYYITPHLGKFFLENDTARTFREWDRNEVGVNEEYFEPVIQGMLSVVNAGTGRGAFVPDVSVAGKTGTVQNPHGEDHSTFIAFAPAEDPQIAIAVYVENAGGGGRFAAPIAGLLIEKYLKGEIHPSKKWTEDRILQADLINQQP